MAKKKKWGKIGAPKSAKRKAWLKSLRKRKGGTGGTTTKKKKRKRKASSRKQDYEPELLTP